MTGIPVGLVLGLDGGGTQTRAAAAPVTGGSVGDIVGRGRAGACNLAAVSPAEAIAAALEAADLALRDAGEERGSVVAICAGIAGFSFADRRHQFEASLQAAFPSVPVCVEPDYAVALTGATGGAPGIIVIAGTGSAAYGENARGERHKTGAYGYLIDDAGSGYGVGRAALAAALRAADGTGEPTSLSERIKEALSVFALSDIIPGVYGGSLSRVVIAGLSRVAATAAQEDNDAVARAIFMRTGGALAQLVQGVTKHLFADADFPFPVAAVGGLWEAGDLLTSVFVRSLRRFAPAAVLTPPQQSPVEGAVQRAAGLVTPAEKFSPCT